MVGRNWIARARLLLAAAVGLVALAAPARADNAGRPMVFAWGVVYGAQKAIFGDGDFTAETPAALKTFLRRSAYSPDTRLYLNSLGGDLAAGMEVGRIIREAHLNTGVARNTRDPKDIGTLDLNANSRVYPGYCISACTLAFLGGVSRQVDAGATYAVHQVAMNCVDRREASQKFPWVVMPNITYCPDLNEALSMVQIASGAVVEYVRSMGADPIFLTEMSKANPNTINPLTQQQLDAYRINFTLRSESWAYETDSEGQFFLSHTQGDEWKEDRVELFCDRTGAARLFMWLVHDTRRSTGRIDPQQIVDLARGGLSVSWELPTTGPGGVPETRTVTLEPYEIISQPGVTQYDNVTATIDLSQRFLDVITKAETFTVSTTDKLQGSTDGFSLITLDLDRDKIAGMLRACR